jgi:hypothetical protein
LKIGAVLELGYAVRVVATDDLEVRQIFNRQPVEPTGGMSCCGREYESR